MADQMLVGGSYSNAAFMHHATDIDGLYIDAVAFVSTHIPFDSPCSHMQEAFSYQKKNLL